MTAVGKRNSAMRQFAAVVLLSALPLSGSRPTEAGFDAFVEDECGREADAGVRGHPAAARALMRFRAACVADERFATLEGEEGQVSELTETPVSVAVSPIPLRPVVELPPLFAELHDQGRERRDARVGRGVLPAPALAGEPSLAADRATPATSDARPAEARVHPRRARARVDRPPLPGNPAVPLRWRRPFSYERTDMNNNPTPYPLAWPTGWPRTRAGDRERSRFRNARAVDRPALNDRRHEPPDSRMPACSAPRT